MQWGPRGQVGAAVLLVSAALVAAVPVQRLEHVPMCSAALLKAQLPAAAAAAGWHRAAAHAQLSHLPSGCLWRDTYLMLSGKRGPKPGPGCEGHAGMQGFSEGQRDRDRARATSRGTF